MIPRFFSGLPRTSEQNMVECARMNRLALSRRDLLRKLRGIGLGAVTAPWLQGASRGTYPNPVGYATISWPDSEFIQALETISKLGFKGVQFLGWVSEKYGGARAGSFLNRLGELKLKPVTLSCSDVNLDPGRPEDETGKVRNYAAFFQKLGGLYLQATDGGQPDGHYSADTIRTLGARMNEMGRLAQQFGLTLGYHPHFGTIGETREGLGSVLDATDPQYVKLIADVGHLTLGGCDPVEVVRTYHSRLILSHFKDVRKEVAALARQNRNLARKEEYPFCEIGEGIVNFSGVLKAFREINFKGWIVVELDGNKPRSGGPAESARMNEKAAEDLGLMV
jgi:inosose dehydratase